MFAKHKVVQIDSTKLQLLPNFIDENVIIVVVVVHFTQSFLAFEDAVHVVDIGIWVIHFMVYPYVVYQFLKDMYAPHPDQDQFESRRIWIPMDIILNSFVAFYYMYHLAIEEPISERLNKLETPTPSL